MHLKSHFSPITSSSFGSQMGLLRLCCSAEVGSAELAKGSRPHWPTQPTAYHQPHLYKPRLATFLPATSNGPRIRSRFFNLIPTSLAGRTRRVKVNIARACLCGATHVHHHYQNYSTSQSRPALQLSYPTSKFDITPSKKYEIGLCISPSVSMSSAARTGADASRPPSSGLITPTSDGRSQAQSDLLPSSGGTKRKLDGSIVMDHLLKPSITVKVSYMVGCHWHIHMTDSIFI